MHLSKVIVDGFRAATKGPLQCDIPGRFSVLLGANGTGKSTITDAIAIAHRDVFPWKPRASSSALTQHRPKTIEVGYEYEDAETLAIWSQRQAQGIAAPAWTSALRSSMGTVRSDVEASSEARDVFSNLPVMYLSSTRNPVDDLAGRDARLIVEMLRSEAKRRGQNASLAGLRKHLGNLISTIISKNPILLQAEQRANNHLDGITTGVSQRQAFLATTDVDDLFLGRVFEFFISSLGGDRDSAHRLELEGLGYANLLQLAVVLAAIPDLTGAQTTEPAGEVAESEGTGPDGDGPLEDDARSPEERVAEVEQAETIAEAAEDTFFKEQFHACVVLEEPEAHLHPQLQHGLIRYLKAVIADRPEIQFILTTHSDEIVAACDPDDLVVLRRDDADQLAARAVTSIGLSKSKLALARRHLDVSRSASLFANRCILVEGITDAQLLRAFGVVWGDGDQQRIRFLDAITIVVLGSRVGSWLPELLVSPGKEIATKVAVLMDSDGKAKPQWAQNHEGDSFQVFLSRPTLEPSVHKGNESLSLDLLEDLGFEQEDPDDPDVPTSEIAQWFKDEGRRTKTRFADRLAAGIVRAPEEATVPRHFRALFDFVYEGHGAVPVADAQREAADSE